MASSLSAAPLLALLHEDDATLQAHALQRLLEVIDVCWADVADDIAFLDALAEDDKFASRPQAALAASKVYYHLEAYPDAVRMALQAGAAFDNLTRSEYVDTIIAHCIDEYTALRKHNASVSDESARKPVDARLEAIVNLMFTRCFEEGTYVHALGVALETHRRDMVMRTIEAAVEAAAVRSASSMEESRTTLVASPGAEFLAYTVDLLTGNAVSAGSASPAGIHYPPAWRKEVLRKIETFYARPGAAPVSQHSVVDYATLARVLQALDDAPATAKLLLQLLRAGCVAGKAGANSAEVLMAYQLALDAVENDNQPFLMQLYISLGAGDVTLASDAASDDGEAAAPASSSANMAFETCLGRLRSIVDGSVTCAAYTDFLSHRCAADSLILKSTKGGVDIRNSVLHHAIVTAHGYMYCGTSVDSFLRSNLGWLGRANMWHKFSASASQGSIYRGRVGDTLTVLKDYLPTDAGVGGDVYSQGGALFALGLIHANRGGGAGIDMKPHPERIVSAPTAAAAGAPAAPAPSSPAAGGAAAGSGDASRSTVAYLLQHLQRSQHEVMQHGACLGLGCAAMATGDEGVYNAVREVLFQESAVKGEGAALGMGMLLAGRGAAWVCPGMDDPAATELLAQAHDTSHEKTIRGIALALAMMSYGLESDADMLIEQLRNDKDAVLRYGGMYAIGLAYVGTGNNDAIRKLLHVAVSDVSDDVRRAATTCLGFVLCRQGREVPTLVRQLTESYNAHVRYGAAMAMGLSCAGTGYTEAVGLLEHMLDDPVDFVRQAALLSLGLVLQQEAEEHLPKVKQIRERLAKTAGDKHMSTMTKMGAILAQGIIDMGGRNCVSTMTSRAGNVRMAAVLGFTLWLQYWYWFPLMHFLSLAAQPTALIALTSDFRVSPTFSVPCNCKPSWFAYPPEVEIKVSSATSKITSVELSLTAKAKAKAAAKEKDKAASSGMEVDAAAGAAPAAADAAASAAADSSAAPAAAAATAASPTKPSATTAGAGAEETSFIVSNLSRVTPSQAKFLDYASAHTKSQRYLPVRLPTNARQASGIMILMDTKPEEADDTLVRLRVPAAAQPTPTTTPAPARRTGAPMPFVFNPSLMGGY